MQFYSFRINMKLTTFLIALHAFTVVSAMPEPKHKAHPEKPDVPRNILKRVINTYPQGESPNTRAPYNPKNTANDVPPLSTSEANNTIVSSTRHSDAAISQVSCIAIMFSVLTLL